MGRSCLPLLPPADCAKGILFPLISLVLCMERLAFAIEDQVDQNRCHPVKISENGPAISHFFFADDVLLFSKAKLSQMRLIQSILQGFCMASGLKANLSKSRAFVSDCVSRAKQDR